MDAEYIDKLTLLLLIVVALAAAWYLGRRSLPVTASRARPELPNDHFIGLNYLLNDEPDEALDTFIAALEINTSSIETHMALGTLLRRRGKVDKSITVYQSLLQRPRLAVAELQRIQLELMRSYVAAGLLDRAERLLEELDRAGPELRRQALMQAVNLFQLEQEWGKAAQCSEELLQLCPPRERAVWQLRASHYYCELAEQDLARQRYDEARAQLRKARRLASRNARVSLLLGRLEMALENFREAVKALLSVKQQDPDFASETAVPLLESYRRSGSQRNLRRFIQDSLEDQPSASFLLALADHLDREEGSRAALDFLLSRLRGKSSLRIMHRALVLLDQEAGQEELQLFRRILDEYFRSHYAYQCRNCGYEAKNLHWLCPGCAEWGMIRRQVGLTGE